MLNEQRMTIIGAIKEIGRIFADQNYSKPENKGLFFIYDENVQNNFLNN